MLFFALDELSSGRNKIMGKVTHIVSILFLVHCSRALMPSTECIDKAKAEIARVIEANSTVPPNRKEYPFIGGFVRLAFHDCVGPGGCDGCVNHDLPDNAGLKRYTDALDIAYSAVVQACMSRADFYALASMVALTKATELEPLKFTGLQGGKFLFGRADCPTSPNEDTNETGLFPDAKFHLEATLEYFRTQFGFSENEVVALIGAHTLGKCSVGFSGYEGKWEQGLSNTRANSDVLNNEFYKQARGNWVQVQVPGSGKIQWQRPISNTSFLGQPPNMFLNSDLSLAWNIAPVGVNGEVICRINCTARGCCPRSATASKFQDYALSNDLWLKDFTDVFLKMVNRNTAVLIPAPVAGRKDTAEEVVPHEELDDYIDTLVSNLRV